MVPAMAASRSATLMSIRNAFSFFYYKSSSLRVRKIPLVQSSFQEVGIFACLGEVSVFGWR